MDLDVLLRDRARALLLQHDQGQRPLTPFLIWYADDSHLTYRLVLRNDVFDRKRRNPFAPTLDNIFDTISDQQISLRIDCSDILRVQVAAIPEFLGIDRIVQIALRKPGARATTSPLVLPSWGTSFICSSTMRKSTSWIGTPARVRYSISFSASSSVMLGFSLAIDKIGHVSDMP